MKETATPRAAVTAALLICSDRASAGARNDETEPRLKPLLEAAGHSLATVRIVADEQGAIEAALRELARDHALVLTSGGTGLSPRDVTVEATLAVVEREVPGLGEAMRAKSLASTPMAMLSRATAGTLGAALIVNLPGSPAGAAECLAVVLPVVSHAARLLAGRVVDCRTEIPR